MRQSLTVAAKSLALALFGVVVMDADLARAATPPYKIAETRLAIGGVSAVVDTTSLAVPKNTASAVRVKVLAGDRVLDADAVRTLLGGPFSLRAELSGPALPQTVSLPLSTAPTLADPFLIPMPPLSTGGEYSLTGVRVVANGQTVLDAAPLRATFQVIDQILITSVKTQQLTPEQLREKGVLLGADAFVGFQFTLGLLMESTPVEISLPVVFDREGVAMPPIIPLPPPITRYAELPPVLPFIAPILLSDDTEGSGDPASDRPALTFADGSPVRIPSVLVIPGDVTYLKAHFGAQLFVANGAPLGTGLQVHDVTGTVKLPLPNPDPSIVLAPLVSGPQPMTMPVRGVGPDGLPGTADDVAVLGPGEQGLAEFVLRAEKEGFHRLEFDIKAELEGLPVGPVTVRGKAKGGVLVRNPRFDMSFVVPNVVRDGERFSFFATITNIGQGPAQDLKVNLDMLALSGAELVCPGTEPCSTVTIPTLPPGDAHTIEFVMDSRRTGAVVASYINFSDDAVTGGLNFSLGIGERGILHSPDTLVMPTGVDLLPQTVLRAAMRVLGQAWSIATAPADRPTPGVTPINANIVREKAHALAEAGLRVQLQQPVLDAVRDLAFDFYGGRVLDPGFDELLRQTRAGRDLAQAIGAALAPQAGTDTAAYERTVSEVAASGADFLAFSVRGTESPVQATLSDASGRKTVSGRSTSEIATTQIPGAAWIPLGAPASAAFLGVLTTPVAGQAYTLDLSGSAQLSLTLPRPNQPFLHVTATTAYPARVTVDLGSAAVTLKEDRNADGTYESAVAVASSSLSSSGPRLVSATIIGSETLPMHFSFGMNLALVYDRAVDATRAADTSLYHLPANVVQAARPQLSGRIVFASLALPEGKHVPIRIAVDAMADSRGVLGEAAEKSVGSRMTAPGAVVSGRVLKADGTPYVGGKLYYLNTVSDRTECSGGTPDWPLATTTVGSDGRYELRYVKQDPCGGSFKLAVHDPVNGSERTVWTFVRQDGEQLVLDLVLIGRGALQGVVRSASNVPVAGARVVAVSVTDPKMGGSAVTDGAGRYTIYNLPVGSVNVTAGKGVYMGRGAGRIDRAGDTGTVDVRLESGAGRISGRVFRLDPGQTVAVPIPGIHVIYFRNGGAGDSSPLGVAQTDSTGKYVLEGMPSGNFTLKSYLNSRDYVSLSSFVAEEQTLDDTDLVIEIPPETQFGSVKGTIRLPNGSPAEGVIVDIGGRGVLTGPDGRYNITGLQLPANPYVHARTRDNVRSGYRYALLTVSNPNVENIDITLSGIGTAVFTVLSPSGQPIRGQAVATFGGCSNPCGCATKVTGPDGKVTFPNLRMGGFGVNVVRTGAGATDQASGSVNLTQDGVTVFGIVRLQGTGTVTGQVKDNLGHPLHGAIVTIVANQFKNDGLYSCGLEPAEKPEIRTGPDGRFVLPNVNAGGVRVRARHEFMSSYGANQGVLLGGETLDLPIVLTNTIAGRLTGTIFLSDGTTPAGGNVDVTVNGPIPDVTVRTNPAGAYSFPEILPMGRYMMTVRDPASGGLARTWVYLNAGQDMAHDVRLLGKGTITIRVVDGAGRLAENALVRVQQTDYPNRTFEGHVQSSVNDGAVTFTDVYQGPFSVEASDVYGRGGRVSATLANPGDTAEVKVTLTVTGSVKGRFLMPDHTTPISFGTIRLIAGGRVIGQTTTAGSGELGRFSFNYVPAGPVRVEASDPATARTGLAVGELVAQDEDLTLDVIAQGLGTIQGTVTSNGVPQPSALVEIVSGGYRANTMADGAGYYIVHGVPEGRITVSGSLEHGLLKASSAATLTGEGATVTIDVALRPTGDIVGTVTKADGTTPALSVVSVGVYGIGGGNFARTTSAEGAFDFQRVPSGTGDVYVDALGTIDRTYKRVEVPAGQTLQLPLKLNGVGGLRGRALNSAGGPTDGILHVHIGGAYPSIYSMTLGPDGLFHLPEVLAGPFTARLYVGTGPLTLYGTATGSVDPDHETVVDVQLQPSGTVTGLIVRADGTTPAYGANVTIEHERGSVMVQAQNDGRFTLKGVPLGSFKVRVKDDVTTGLATLRNQQLTSNGQTRDVGTLVLDDAPPAIAVITPVDGSTQKAVGAVLLADFSDVGSGLDFASMYVRYPSGGMQSGSYYFTWEGNRVRGALELSAMRIGTNTFWVGIRDLAGNLSEKKITYVSTGMTVSGIVRWSDGSPAAGVEVNFGGTVKPITGPDGTYVQGGFRPNNHLAIAKDPVTGIQKYAWVMLYDGEDNTLNITLPAYGYIRGVVTHADGTPAAGAKVAWMWYRETTTAADGSFDLGAFDLGPNYVISASDARGDQGQTSVQLSSPGQVAHVAIRMTGVGKVIVTVLDGTTPFQGASVTVRSSALIGSVGYGTSGTDGKAVIDKILAGTITATATDNVRNLSGQAAPALLTDNGTVALTVVLEPAGRVAGTVRHADGTPAANVDVMLSPGYRTTKTDANGAYAFETVKLGEFTVRATEAATGDTAQKIGVLFNANVTAVADINLNGVGSVRVTVKDASDAIVPEAHVWLTMATGFTYYKRADAEGVAYFPYVLAGTIRVDASNYVIAGTLPPVELVPGGSLDLVVRLQPAGTIRGKVLEPDGVTPVANADVYLGYRKVVSESDGSYAFTQVPLSTGQIVYAYVNGRMRAQRSGLNLTTNGQVLEVDLILVGIGTVNGLVTNASDAPAVGAQVTLTSSAYPFGGSYSITTGTDGRYSIAGVAIGAFTISAAQGGQRVDQAGAILNHGDVVVIDLKMLSSAVTLPLSLYDGNLQAWTVNKIDASAWGPSSVLYQSPALTLFKDGTALPFAPDTAVVASEENKREVVVNQSLGGLNVRRKVYIPNNGYFVRFLDVLENPGDTPITVDVLERNHVGWTGYYNANPYDSSSGDDVVDAQDSWVLMDAAEDDLGYELWQFSPMGFVFAGPGGQAADVAEFQKLAPTDQYLSYRWNAVTVQPGQRVGFLHVITYQSHRWRARPTVDRLQQLPPELLAGLSVEEGAIVRNFAVPANLETTVPPLAPFDGIVTGQVLAGDGVTVVPNASVAFQSRLVPYGRVYGTAMSNGSYQVHWSDYENRAVVVPREPFNLTVSTYAFSATRAVTAQFDFPRTGVRNLTNALGATVRTSSFFDSWGCCVAQHAVDNDLATSWTGATNDRSGPPHFATPYIEVRLPDEATIHTVKVRGRRDGYDGIRRATIELRDSSGNVIQSQLAEFPAPNRDGDVSFDPPVAGVRTVRLISVAEASVVIHEIEVWGEAAFGASRVAVAHPKFDGYGLVAGRVLRADGTTITGAPVRLYKGTDSLYTSSDASGAFLFPVVPAGDYEIEAIHPLGGWDGQQKARVPVSVTVNTKSIKDVVFPAFGSVQGAFFTAAGQPTLGSAVIRSASGYWQGQYGSGTTYTFSDVPPGEYTVSATDVRNNTVKTVPVVVTASTPTVQNITFPVVGIVDVVARIKGTTTPVAGPVSWRSPEHADQYVGYADALGRFTINHVSGPTFTIKVALASNANAFGEATATFSGEADRLTVNVEVPGEGTVTGVVRTRDGQPVTVANATTVTVWHETNETQFGSVSADAAGAFSVPKIPVGPVRLRAQIGEYTNGTWQYDLAEVEAELTTDGAVLSRDALVSRGVLSAGQRELWTATIASGTVVYFSGLGTGTNPPDLYLEVYGPDGALVGSNDNRTTTDKNPAVTFNAATTGEYVVSLRAVGTTAGAYRLGSYYSNVHHVLHLPTTAMVYGRVVHGPTGAALSGATVRVTIPSTSETKTATTAADGTYLFPSLPTETAVVVELLDGAGHVLHRVERTTGAAATGIDVPLTRPGLGTVVVRSIYHGQPYAAGLVVTVTSNNSTAEPGLRQHTGVTGPDATVSFTSVATGLITATATDPNTGLPITQTGELTDQGTLPLDLASTDVTAPAAITTLAVTSPSMGVVTLSWTAPGDDGTTGTAAGYDLRYSTSPIDAGNFAAATTLAAPAPAAAGTTQSVTATLPVGHAYFFAILTRDAVNNVSALSNVATVDVLDIIAPAAVTDLYVNSPAHGVVRLHWTAPGDDGTTGTAHAYEIRTSTAPITEANFAAADPVLVGLPAPAAPGTPQTVDISLTTGHVYYFALKTSDERPNWSPISNTPSFDLPDVFDGVAPAAINDLAAASPEIGVVSLTWTSPGDDGTTGTAAAYDIRYSNTTITEASFAQATPLAARPAPLVAGTAQGMQLTLPTDQVYYFAARTRDEADNWSSLSNIATVSLGDITPPAAVSNLAAVGTSPGVVAVSWTAPGDDGMAGIASAYDLRYSAAPITAENFLGATPLEAPVPLASGTSQVVELPLAMGQTYYFALKTRDEVPNWSPLSNAVSLAVSALPPGAKLWVKADAGITKDETGLVSAWADQSGNGNHLTMLGAAAPTPTPIPSTASLQVNGSSTPVSVAPGASITVNVSGGPGFNTDWIGLQLPNSAAGSYVAWKYLNGLTSAPATGVSSANVTFTAPATPGLYHFRLYQQNGNTMLAMSPIVAVLPPTRPSWRDAEVNGRPVVRFDGVDDYLKFNTRLTAVRTVFWAIREAASTAAGYRNLLGDSVGYPFFGGPQRQIWDTTYAHANVRNGETYVNGERVDGTVTNRPTSLSVISVVTTGDVAADEFSRDASAALRSWSGDLAELIIYERALSPTERKTVEDYLAVRYSSFTPIVERPLITPNGGRITAPTAVTMTAGASAEIRYTVDGSDPTPTSTLYTAGFSVENTTTVKAKAFLGPRASAPAIAAFLADDQFHPSQVSGLKLWVRADSGIQETNGRVSQWADATGTNGSLTQTDWKLQPLLVTNSTTGRPALRFDGADDYLQFPSRLTTIRTVFWVVHENASTPNGYRFLLGDSTNYHFIGGVVRQIWDPGYAPPIIRDGDTRLNGVLINGTTTNRPTTPSVISLVTTGPATADSFSRDRGTNTAYFWNGELAEMIIYDRALTPSERKAVDDYLALKYNTTYTPTLNAPKFTPNGGAFSGSAAVSITANPGASIRYTTDGTEPTASSALYTEPLTLTSTTTLKAKAFQSGWTTSPTGVVGFVSNSTFHPGTLSGLKVWVRADAGVDEVNGLVTQWTDQSGTNNHLTQATTTPQPLFIASGLDGRPTLRFDGTFDFLSFTTRLTTIRTVFWVVNENASAGSTYRFLLGDSSNYDFMGGWTRQIWEAGYANLFIRNGVTRVNGAAVNGTTTTRPTTPSVLSLVTTGAVTADSFSRDRGGANYRWFGDMAELVIYDRALTDAERLQVEQYLGARHGITIP